MNSVSRAPEARRDARIAKAQARLKAAEGRTPEQQLASLDAAKLVATKERKKLQKQIQDRKPEPKGKK